MYVEFTTGSGFQTAKNERGEAYRKARPNEQIKKETVGKLAPKRGTAPPGPKSAIIKLKSS